MKKKILLLTLASSLTMASFAQTIKDRIDQAAKNPSTKENAARADVRLHDKKIIADSSSLKNPPQVLAPNQKRRKSCSKKSAQ